MNTRSLRGRRSPRSLCRRMTARTVILAALGPLTLPGLLQAQSSTTQQLWLDLLPRFRVNDRLEYFGDVGIRIDFSEPTQNSVLVRPSVRYQLSSSWEVHGGVGFFYTVVESAPNELELRPWQGIRLNWPSIRRFHLKHYVRLEERIVWETDTWDSDLTLRLRYELGTAVPLNASSSTYLPLAAEVFANIGESSVEAFRNRGRLYLGLGQRLGRMWAVEVQLILQSSRSTSDDSLTLSDEILRVRFIRVGLPWWGKFVDPRQIGRQ